MGIIDVTRSFSLSLSLFCAMYYFAVIPTPKGGFFYSKGQFVDFGQ